MFLVVHEIVLLLTFHVCSFREKTEAEFDIELLSCDPAAAGMILVKEEATATTGLRGNSRIFLQVQKRLKSFIRDDSLDKRPLTT